MSWGLVAPSLHNRGLVDRDLDGGGLFDRTFLLPLEAIVIEFGFVQIVDITFRVPAMIAVRLTIPEMAEIGLEVGTLAEMEVLA